MWEHIIYDDFLEPDDLEAVLDSINEHTINSVGKWDLDKYTHAVHSDGSMDCTLLDEQLVKGLHERYHPKMLGMLMRLCPEKIPLYEYSDFCIVITGRLCRYPIHTDTRSKILSGVIYLTPNKNTGTILYSSRGGADKSEIEWKTNKGLFFARNETKTWHSYEADGKSNRVVLAYNLCTHKGDLAVTCEGSHDPTEGNTKQ